MLLQGSNRPGKVLEFDLVLDNSWNLKKCAFCPGIVLEFCKTILENMHKSLKNTKNTTSPFRFIGCARKLCEIRKKKKKAE